MRNLSRWAIWGGVGATAVLAAILLGVLWLMGSSDVPKDAILVPQDAPSLQAALKLASAGQTIAIQPSAGAIQGPIVIATPDLSIVSIGDRVTLNAIGTDPAVSLQADGVTFRGFDIFSECVGIQVGASNCRIEDVHIESATIGIQLARVARCVVQSVETKGGQIGVELIESRNTEIGDLAITGASDYGVRLHQSGYNVLKDLVLSENDVGVLIEAASENNVIMSGQIKSSSHAGIQIRSANDNRLLSTSLDSCRVGVILEAVTGTEILECSILASTESAVTLQQAVQNRILETQIDGSQGSGIQLTQSAENALFYNRISDCHGSGIVLVTSGRNLLMGNEVDECSTGIRLSRSSDTRILRNRVSQASLCGVYLSQGESNRLLDNTVSGGAFGLVVTESGNNMILRNVIRHSEQAGMLLIRSAGANHVAENDISGNVRGLILAAATRDLITQNHISRNEDGIVIAGLGSGVRIEGNMLLENGIGLTVASNLDDVKADLDALGIELSQADEHSVPILANNTFKNNERFDIQNKTSVPLPAADNWWGAISSRDVGEAVVSGDVSLEQSAWNGVIAVGAGANDVGILLGRILQGALTDVGFRVIDLVGMGPSTLVQQAFADSDVDLIWWSGVTAGIQPSTGTTPLSVVSTAAVKGWRVIVSAQLAGQLASPSVSDLADWVSESGTLLCCATTSEFSKESADTFLDGYGLTERVRSFIRAEALEEVEALLKFGAVDVAIVQSLEETLTRAGFLAITDDLQLLDEESISIVGEQSVSVNYPEISGILAILEERLTTDALHDLVSRIRLLHQEPEDVARAFLQP